MARRRLTNADIDALADAIQAKGKKKRKGKKKKRRLPEVLGPKKVVALNAALDEAISAARTPKKRQDALRDRMMVMVGLLAGLRVSEICNLDVSDLDLETPVLFVRKGKGDKDRYVPIAAKLLAPLKIWIGDRRSGPLFTGPRGRRIAPRTFQARLDALGRKANIPDRVHPHLLRHVFATSLLRSGSDITEVQELLGHSSIQVTAIYLHVDASRLKQSVDRL